MFTHHIRSWLLLLLLCYHSPVIVTTKWAMIDAFLEISRQDLFQGHRFRWAWLASGACGGRKRLLSILFTPGGRIILLYARSKRYIISTVTQRVLIKIRATYVRGSDGKTYIYMYVYIYVYILRIILYIIYFEVIYTSYVYYTDSSTHAGSPLPAGFSTHHIPVLAGQLL